MKLRLVAFTLLLLVSSCFTAQCASLGITEPPEPSWPELPAGFTVVGRVEPVLGLLYDAFYAADKEFGFVGYGFERNDSIFMDDLCIPPQAADSQRVIGALWDACPSARRIAWGHSHIKYWCHLSTIDVQVVASRPEPYTVLICRVNNVEQREIIKDGQFIAALYSKEALFKEMNKSVGGAK